MLEYIYYKTYFKYTNIKIFIIDSCNYNCQYCYNKLPRTNEYLDLNSVLLFLQKIYNFNKRPIRLEIFGGEPTLHPNLIQFCIDLQKYTFIKNILIYSNFTQSLNYYLKLLTYTNIQIDFSWHSINNTINSDFIKKIIQLSKHKEIIHNVTLSILLEPKNIDLSLHVIKLLQHIKLDIDIIKVINDISTYQLLKKLPNYSADMLIKLNNILQVSYKNKYKTVHLKTKNIDRWLSDIEACDICYQQKDLFYKWHCTAGIRSFYIHCNGDCYPCQQKYELQVFKPMFNINDNNIKFNTQPLICDVHNCSREQYITKWNRI